MRPFTDVSVLDGSPYSFEDGSGFRSVGADEARIRLGLDEAREKLVASLSGQVEVAQQQESREIYESNKIEGLGPSLERTAELLLKHRGDEVRDQGHPVNQLRHVVRRINR
ncbi:hypothetical protein GCM10011594_31440 [Nakamurella endophytica]|uniref:Uncharacterized protein n=1 Tax=Nakamurella endophytica TaxID=1748367 RepID=A0A917T3T7_9ACTN|nr:hypothetical protein GCM10011594_31440 [Nakamurella endophytica]